MKYTDMATKRQMQVGELIKRNFSIVLQQHGSYIYGGALVTVTNVIMTPDFALAKVYLSVYGAESKEEVIKAVRAQMRMIKPDLAKRLKRHVRRIPVFDVYQDEMVDEMYRVDQLLQNLNGDKNTEAASEEE